MENRNGMSVSDLIHFVKMPSKTRIKLLAPLAVGLFVGFLYKGWNGELQQQKQGSQYDSKNAIKQHLNQGLSGKKQ